MQERSKCLLMSSREDETSNEQPRHIASWVSQSQCIFLLIHSQSEESTNLIQSSHSMSKMLILSCRRLRRCFISRIDFLQTRKTQSVGLIGRSQSCIRSFRISLTILRIRFFSSRYFPVCLSNICSICFRLDASSMCDIKFQFQRRLSLRRGIRVFLTPQGVRTGSSLSLFNIVLLQKERADEEEDQLSSLMSPIKDTFKPGYLSFYSLMSSCQYIYRHQMRFQGSGLKQRIIKFLETYEIGLWNSRLLVLICSSIAGNVNPKYGHFPFKIWQYTIPRDQISALNPQGFCQIISGAMVSLEPSTVLVMLFCSGSSVFANPRSQILNTPFDIMTLAALKSLCMAPTSCKPCQIHPIAGKCYFETVEQLFEYGHCFHFLNLIGLNVLLQGASIAVLHHDVDKLFGLETVVEPDDVAIVALLHYKYLCGDEADMVGAGQSGLVDNFSCTQQIVNISLWMLCTGYKITSGLVIGLEDLAPSAFANHLQKGVTVQFHPQVIIYMHLCGFQEFQIN